MVTLRRLALLASCLGLSAGLGSSLGIGQAGALHSPAAALPVGTAFTYQGQLKQDGTPTNGNCDFQFALWDAAIEGTQVGWLEKPRVPVVDGLFAVQLDFGAAAFDGDARWLEVAVRCPAGQSGAYSTLSPRQALTPAPYALYASSVPWSGVTGAPSLQQRVGGTCAEGSSIQAINADGTVICQPDHDTTYTAGTGLTLADNQFSVSFGSTSATVARGDHAAAYQAKYSRTVVVGPVGDGSDPVANGTALLDALAGIAGASATKPYLLKIEPGVYDVGTTTLAMKPWVVIEGSGELTTRIKGHGSGDSSTGTVIGADDAELRFLTVENVGAAQRPRTMPLPSTTAEPHLASPT